MTGQLTSAGWRTLSEAQRLTFYDALLEALPSSFVPERSVGLQPGAHPAVLHDATGLRFVVVLGGPVELGLTPARLERARQALARRWYDDTDVSDVGLPTPPGFEPPRARSLEPYLLADAPAPFGVWRRLGLLADDLGIATVPLSRQPELSAALAAHGLRLPTADEWEFACWFGLDHEDPAPLVNETHRRSLCWDDLRQAIAVFELGSAYELPQRVPVGSVRSAGVWPAMNLKLRTH